MYFFLSIFVRNFCEFCMAVRLSVLVIFTEFLLTMIPFGHVILPNYVPSFFSWWEIMKHLSWTLLGVTELDVFNAGVETPSDHVAQALYAVFIIAALVLLVNMMIAVLSNTYERLQVILSYYRLFFKKKNTQTSLQIRKIGRVSAVQLKILV